MLGPRFWAPRTPALAGSRLLLLSTDLKSASSHLTLEKSVVPI
jgi:hypothetical protein